MTECILHTTTTTYIIVPNLYFSKTILKKNYP